MAISFKGLGASSKVQKIDIIKSTASWTAPADVTKIEITLCGGGGGGNGGEANDSRQGAGGSGSVFYDVLTVVPGTSYTITIGAGGTAGTAGNLGGTGTTSTFGGLMTATGGTTIAGQPASISTIPAGKGGGGGQSFVVTAVGAVPHSDGQQGAFGFGGGGGAGGSQRFGNGALGGGRGGYNYSSPVAGSAAQANTGSGGGGGLGKVSGASAGGAGGSGVCVIKYWSAF